ncbi:MAG: FAD-binding oxidoreductase [Flavobacteriaceae bacterium]
MVKALKNIVGLENVLHDGAEKARFSHIWATDIPLAAKGVVFPQTTEQVSEVVKLFNSHGQEVIIHGGLTNLVGGTQTTPNQWVLSLEKMNVIEEIDESAKTITVQAGVILEQLIETAAQKSLFLPLNFGAKGSAQIGGVIATNAGGMRVFRYGMTRTMVLGLEVVLANGTIISSLKKIIKDNSGYDLKQLFIGAEGTLGVITKACLRLYEQPTSRYAALVGVQSFQEVVSLLRLMDKNLSGNLSSFELMWNATYCAATSANTAQKPPLPQDYPYYVFIESLGNDLAGDYALFEDGLTRAAEKEIIVDAVLAQSKREVEKLWSIREDTHILRQSFVATQHFDISLPIGVMDAEVAFIVADLEALPFVERVLPFGHIADGNIHLIVGKKDTTQQNSKKINAIVYRNLKKHLGSVSAEHGIGLDKKDYLYTSKTSQEIALMKTLKQTLDPKNILNPNRIF